jgi:YD repeat-containing protein
MTLAILFGIANRRILMVSVISKPWKHLRTQIGLLLCLMLVSTFSFAQNAVREPVHGYWVAFGPSFTMPVHTLFPDWYSAAIAQCGGKEYIHPNTTPPVADQAPANLYCYYWPNKDGYQWVGGAYYSDACPETITPQPHDATRKCYGAPETPPDCPCHGDPVKFGNKEEVLFEKDYTSPKGLEFVRYYSSKLQADQGALGYSWRHTYAKTLTLKKYDPQKTYTYQWHAKPDGTGSWTDDWGPFSAGQQAVNIFNPDGYGYYFASTDGGNTWATDGITKPKLLVGARDAANNPTQWLLTLENGDIEVYDASGRLAEIRYLRGRKITLSYSTPATIDGRSGVLTDVANDLGQSLHFTYDEAARITTMTDPAGNIYQYTYGGKFASVNTVTYPGGGHREYYYDETDSVNSKTSAWQYLTGIADEITPGNVVRTGSIKYNDKGWPISAARANNIEQYTFDYTTNSVTDPLGAVRKYWFSTVNGKVVVGSLMQTYGTVSSTASYSYDANGNRNSDYDFKGNRVYKTFDLTRNLELTSTEAFNDTSVKRTTTTSWHPTLPLPLKVAEALRITTYTYDTVGNLLTKSIQATTDANGSLGLNAAVVGPVQTWTYTYNAASQVLTIKGPRTDVNDTTTFTYDTAGNLTSIVNAAGHTTSMSNYDVNGRPGTITKPNGETISMTYTPRGWLSSLTVSADGHSQTTSYDYDGVGNMTKVTLPDGSAINYGYDDASRLISLSDTLGNRIDYTLDGLGNHTAEQVRDPGGTLARQTSRIFDNLGRMTQQTGGAQ